MIALYPGAFKPPHRGHFNVVKSLLDGSYSGAIYDKDNYKEKGEDLLGGTNGEKPSIDKVIVFVNNGNVSPTQNIGWALTGVAGQIRFNTQNDGNMSRASLEIRIYA